VREILRKLLTHLVGAIGFEPTTPCAQGTTHTNYQSVTQCTPDGLTGISGMVRSILRNILRLTFLPKFVHRYQRLFQNLWVPKMLSNFFISVHALPAKKARRDEAKAFLDDLSCSFAAWPWAEPKLTLELLALRQQLVSVLPLSTVARPPEGLPE
jgi:hypothetical protein